MDQLCFCVCLWLSGFKMVQLLTLHREVVRMTGHTNEDSFKWGLFHLSVSKGDMNVPFHYLKGCSVEDESKLCLMSVVLDKK